MKIYEVWGLISTIDALDQIAAGNGASGSIIRPGALIPTTPNQMAFMALVANKVVTINPLGEGWSTNDGTLFPWGGKIGAFDSQYRPIMNFLTLDVQSSFSLPSAWAMAIATFRSIVLPVQGTFNMAPATNAVVTAISPSTNPVQFLTANSTRRGVSVFNKSDPASSSAATIFITYNGFVNKNLYVTKILPGELWEMPMPLFNGGIYGWWNSFDGGANITEMI
jgi:hypothetical protein